MQYQVNCTLELKGGCHDWNADYMNGGQVALRASCGTANYAVETALRASRGAFRRGVLRLKEPLGYAFALMRAADNFIYSSRHWSEHRWIAPNSRTRRSSQ
jgi:hypothetical protein